MAICKVCGHKSTSSKYCPQCGSSLKNCENVSNTTNNTEIKQKNPINDESLKIIVDCIKKTVATVGGDGYDETVLYFDETKNQYSIHVYRQYQYNNNLLCHKAYLTNEEFKNDVLNYIKESNIIQYKNKSGRGLCGGLYACSFIDGEQIVRISTDNMLYDGPSVLSSIHSYLNSGINENLEIFE